MSAILNQERARQSGQRAHDNAQPPEADPGPDFDALIEQAVCHASPTTAYVPYINHTFERMEHTSVLDVVVEAVGNHNASKTALLDVLLSVKHPAIDRLKLAAARYWQRQQSDDLQAFHDGKLFDWQEAA